jgi:large subunit ribosomal protein L17
MRHRVKIRKLTRSQGHYRATMANLAGSLIEHKQIETTLAKAKELRPYIEKLITHAKTDSVHKRRVVNRKLNNRDLIYELFHVIGPKNTDRDGGYTRILKLGKRRGDGTEMALIQLLGFEAYSAPAKAKPKAKKEVEESASEGPLLDLSEEKNEVEKNALSKEVADEDEKATETTAETENKDSAVAAEAKPETAPKADQEAVDNNSDEESDDKEDDAKKS